ncbi:MAG: hypothetical protein WCK67_12860 [bacterium]
MKESNLLASVALFSALYNNENFTNISDILAEFIKGAVISEKKWTVNSNELTNLLEKVYEFKIPESVVRTTVRNRLKITPTIHGHYVFNSSIEKEFISLNENYESIVQVQSEILEALISFIDSKVNTPLTPEEKDAAIQNFKSFIIDNGSSEKYSKLISAFLIKNREDTNFTQNLNLIREGVILYQGIRYTADLNELGRWNTDLKIFLSTEHLFNALGYNGSLFQQIFDDFYELVKQINTNTKNKHGEKIVELKYFQETKDQVDAFFKTAEYILKGTSTLDPSKTAMKKILEDCKTLSDIKAKRIKFDLELKRKGIFYQEFSQSIYTYPEYLVEDNNLIDTLKQEAYGNQKLFDENLCRQFLQIFTKINYYRGGLSKTKFENIGTIFITGNRFALYLAHQTKVKFKEEDIPFAKDIDYITSKFWFKLKKGFGDKQLIPKSLDVICKAQIILSSQLNQTVYKEFNKLQQQFRGGELTKEEALERSYVLREKSVLPEDLNPETLDTTLDFLNKDEFFEDYYREKVKKDLDLKQALHERDELKRELDFRILKEENELYQKALAKFNSEKLEYSTLKWKQFKIKKRNDLLYFISINILTFVPLFITLFLKGNKCVNDKIEKLGSNQNFIWSFLALIFLIELFGRSYIFDKEKVKSGWVWLKTLVHRTSYDNLKRDYIVEFQNDFEELNKVNTVF